MFHRQCPKCEKKTLRIPFVSEWFTCETCSSVFALSNKHKWLYKFGAVPISLLAIYGVFQLLEFGQLSLVGFGLLIYLIIPIASSFLLKVCCLYWGKLHTSMQSVNR